MIYEGMQTCFFFFLWFYSPIFGLDRLRETFRFISVTRSRTVGRTPWSSYQFVARPIVPALGNCEDGEVGGMKRFWQGKPKYSEKPAPTPHCPPQITCQTRAAAVGSQRLTASAMARPASVFRMLFYTKSTLLLSWRCNLQFKAWTEVPDTNGSSCFTILFLITCSHYNTFIRSNCIFHSSMLYANKAHLYSEIS
jgi:hypothetical protein